MSGVFQLENSLQHNFITVNATWGISDKPNKASFAISISSLYDFTTKLLQICDFNCSVNVLISSCYILKG